MQTVNAQLLFRDLFRTERMFAEVFPWFLLIAIAALIALGAYRDYRRARAAARLRRIL